MTTKCTKCGQPSGHRLCQECRLEREHESFQKEAEEKALGISVNGPDAEDRHVVGGDDDA